jgi:hypothetical protein
MSQLPAADARREFRPLLSRAGQKVFHTIYWTDVGASIIACFLEMALGKIQ